MQDKFPRRDPGIDNHGSWTSPRKEIEIADAVMLTILTMSIAFALLLSARNDEKSSRRIAPTETPAVTPTLIQSRQNIAPF